MNADVYRLGVDFGTTSTAAAMVMPGATPTPLLFDASPLLPSAVFCRGADVLTGVDAERAGAGYPAGLEPNPKRRIDDGVVWLGEAARPVVDLVTAVLRRVAGEADQVAGRAPDEVVLTHPATWSGPRLDVLTTAAGRAGWSAATLVPEPVAAAAYFSDVLGRRVPDGHCLVVYDLGAGTFDVAVVHRAGVHRAGGHRAGGFFDVLAADGLDNVGGLDLDAAVVGHLRALTATAPEWTRLDNPRTATDRHGRRALWRDVRTAKEQLSRTSTVDVHIPLVGADLHLTREEFERLAMPLLERTVATTLTAVRAARIRRDRISGIFLVGGASRVPLIATLLHRALGIAPTTIGQPELAVAVGGIRRPPAPVPLPGGAPTRGALDLRSPSVADQSVDERQPRSDAVRRSGQGARQSDPARHAADRTTRRPVPAAYRPHGNTDSADEETGQPSPAPFRPSRRTVLITATVWAAAVTGAVWLRRDPSEPEGGGRQTPSSTHDEWRVATLTGHTQPVRAVAFGPGGLLASAGEDLTIQLWQAAEPTATPAALTGHTKRVDSLAFSPDGTTLASAGWDETVRLWDVAGRRQSTMPLPSGGQALYRVSFRSDGRVMAGAASHVIRLWDVSTMQVVHELRRDQLRAAYFEDAVLSPDGATLAVVTDAYDAYAVDVRAQSAPRALSGHLGHLFGIAVGPDNDTVATCSIDETTRLFSAARGTNLATLRGHSGSVFVTEFSPDGRLVATGGQDHTVRLWDVATGKPVDPPLIGHTDSVGALAFSPDGRTLASGGLDNTVRLWRIT